MKDLKARLASLAGQLRDIEAELEHEAKQGHIQFNAMDEQLLKDVKDAVDRVRHMIWPYVQAAASRTEDVDATIQRYRMERVTDMLENLKSRVETPDLQDAPEVRSFFTNIQQIATSAVEKHLERVAKSVANPPALEEAVLTKRFVN